MTSIPTWLLPILAEQGKLNPDRISRKATARYCRDCGVVVMRGLDGDVAALPVTCDPHPLSALGEVLALLEDRHTYELRWCGDHYEIDHRDASRITSRPAGSGHGLDVLAAHRCHVPPVALDPRGRVAKPAPQPKDHECPF